MSTRPGFIAFLVAVGCGGGNGPGPTTPRGVALVEHVADARWYRSSVPCGQGPYELTVPIEGGRWDEEVTLQLQTSHAVAIKAIAYGPDDHELAKVDATFGSNGRVDTPPANQKCVADDRERALLLARGGTGGGTPGGPSGVAPTAPTAPTPPTIKPELELDTTVQPYITQETRARAVLELRLPAATLPPGSIVRIKFWSVQPNDLVGVAFGVVRRAWRPNVSVAEYDHHLAQLAAAHDAELATLRARAAAEQRTYELELQREHAEAARREAALTPAQRTARDEAAARRMREAEAANRRRVERSMRDRREAQLRYEASVRTEAERRAQREAFCAAHHDDRGCWGAGGFAMKAKLDARGVARDQFCAQNVNDARCWSAAERAKRQAVWTQRIEVLHAPPPPIAQPSGPPPLPLAEQQPPRLSAHAEWRPGYWLWLDGKWVWLAGQWNVPDADLVAETTTEAPAAPPPPQPEVIAAPPARTTVWVSGFWQWSGSQWIWIAGSWQVRPNMSVEWRAPTWRVKGRVHVLVPGAWIRLGGGR